MAANDDITYVLPSLLELAYNACSDGQRKQYDKLPVPSLGLQVCCKSIVKIIHLNSNVVRFNHRGDRRSMFPKVQPFVQSQFSDHYLIKDICEMAAFHGHLDCIKLARAIGVPWYSPTLAQKSACDRAAESGNLECLIYAHTNGARWCEFTCAYAAGNGHLNCLVYMRDHGCPWTDLTISNAASHGHMECLVYAFQNGCPWSADTCRLAVSGGLEFLQYCRENGCPWDVDTCEMAAFIGKLDCLKYARDNGCPWNEGVCNVAAEFGQLECLKYAYENGCEWNAHEYILSAKTNPRSLRYAHEVISRLTENEQN